LSKDVETVTNKYLFADSLTSWSVSQQRRRKRVHGDLKKTKNSNWSLRDAGCSPLSLSVIVPTRTLFDGKAKKENLVTDRMEESPDLCDTDQLDEKKRLSSLSLSSCSD
jgi:hypothetical protein